MSNNVVYWLGAGASFNAIPVVSGMAKRMQTMLNYYRFHDTRRDISLYQSNTDISDKWDLLISEVLECYSIDTLARRSYLRGDYGKLEDIKQFIGAYILWEQIVKPDDNSFPYMVNMNPNAFPLGNSEATNRFNYSAKSNSLLGNQDTTSEVVLRNYDYRYESLLSLIATDRYKLDERFSFISWNYDNQVEMAVNRIFNIDGIGTKHEPMDELRKNDTLDRILNKRLIKLNGSASESFNDFEPVSRFSDTFRTQELNRIHVFLVGKQAFKHRVKFAWEESTEFDRMRAIPLLQEAKHIVIIGYSFPEYNRHIDKQLIEAASKGFSSKIIVQDTLENVDKIESRIKSIIPKHDVIKYTDLNQFYVPL